MISAAPESVIFTGSDSDESTTTDDSFPDLYSVSDSSVDGPYVDDLDADSDFGISDVDISDIDTSSLLRRVQVILGKLELYRSLSSDVQAQGAYE